ncbi:MAG: hypothetical protein OQK48_03580 [Sulfurimonas sp.]|uniref:hypothetical protein n=1 Tax=Sulfurimonas sp. TaxID=2022749 RepID=UPI0026174B3F|nr:hypothetical protein [Sulfurimonas sp.]MCW8894257.1 hypothetical protein [Sulfurimonas sp.]MCW8954002.1 hypothetical protein [Sulfurimonas sp.]MCW9067056.1 hypothetical protein [Sulfurimonas sp.]
MKTLLILFLTINLYADIKQNMFNLYQNKQYEEVCNIGFNNFSRYRQNEEYISLYAFACLKADYIDRLSIPIATLKYSKEARANSAYLSIILMQKKLLYHALIDNYDLSSIDLPTTDYVLSKVFDLYAKLNKHEPRAFYLFEDEKDSKLTYKLYLIKDDKLSKIVIEEYYNSDMIKRHIYW